MKNKKISKHKTNFIKKSAKHKKFKVVMTPGALKDLKSIPKKERKAFLKELDNVAKNLAAGKLIGEPVDMEELAVEEPNTFNMLIKRHDEFMKAHAHKQDRYSKCIVPNCPEKPMILKVIAERRPLTNGQVYEIKIDVPMCATHKSYLDSGHIKFKYNPAMQSITGLDMDELLVSSYGTERTKGIRRT